MNESLKKFRQRIVRNALIKTFLCAAVIACGVLIVSALASWIFGFQAGIWLSVGLFVGSFAAAFTLFYLFKFRPSDKDVARAVDSLGLEERLVTMMELEGDESYIARIQRADAKAALAKADHTLLKVTASVALLVAVGVSAVFGIGALTVDSLYSAGVIPSAVALAETHKTNSRSFTLKYNAKSGGKIYYLVDGALGDEVEDAIVVAQGEDAPAIIAYPDNGYVFTGWSDGKYDPYRQERAVANSLSLNATFEKVSLAPDLLEDGDPNSDSNNNNNNNNNNPPPNDMPPDDGDGDGDNFQNAPDGSGQASDNNMVNNGSTYYGDEYDGAYNDTLDRLGDGSDIPDNLQGGINDYMGSIGRGGSDGGEGGN